MTPDPRTPGSVTTNTREPPAAATTSGSRSIAPTPNWTRLRRTISSWRSAERVIATTSTTVSVEVSRRTVSQRRQPDAWNQRSVVAPVGVVEDPDLVEVALVGVGDRVGDRAALAAEA